MEEEQEMLMVSLSLSPKMDTGIQYVFKWNAFSCGLEEIMEEVRENKTTHIVAVHHHLHHLASPQLPIILQDDFHHPPTPCITSQCMANHRRFSSYTKPKMSNKRSTPRKNTSTAMSSE